MGARIPPNARPRRGGFKCEFCGRAVHSLEALQTHQNILHSTALRERIKQKTIAVKPSRVRKPEPRKLVARKARPKPVPKGNNTAVSEKNKPKSDQEKAKLDHEKAKPDQEKAKPDKIKPKTGKDNPKPDNKVVKEKTVSPKMDTKVTNSNSKSKMLRKTEFKCPKCEKCFPVLFSAQKHIQKKHCVNENDEAVSPTSPDLIQPVSVELCLYCNNKFPLPHDCPNRPVFGVATSYNCTGCQQRFQSNKLFDIHVGNVHGDHSENMFFPSEEEFNTWKDQMEAQTQCKYIVMGRYSSKQVYRCANSSDDSSNDEVLFCPSMIVKSDLPKGFQINFYLTHHGHDCNDYELSDQYKSYSVTDLLEQGGCDLSDLGSDDSDLYLQFKSLMENIVFDAAKININMLKILVGKALDMTSILTQYDEDEDTVSSPVSSTLSLTTSKRDDQITKALEGLRSSQRNKRHIEENGTGEKRWKSDKKQVFSLADDKDTDKILQELESNKNATPNNEVEHLKNPTQSPSFNDTYKNFIKSAQIKVNDKTVPAKKKVVKTKIGQFKPSISPKVKRASRSSLSKAKEPEYEVREQADDCNILVLKI